VSRHQNKSTPVGFAGAHCFPFSIKKRVHKEGGKASAREADESVESIDSVPCAKTHAQRNKSHTNKQKRVSLVKASACEADESVESVDSVSCAKTHAPKKNHSQTNRKG